MRDSSAAKNLLYRRLRSLSNYEAANKNLDKARAKNKDVTSVSLRDVSHRNYFIFIIIYSLPFIQVGLCITHHEKFTFCFNS